MLAFIRQGGDEVAVTCYINVHKPGVREQGSWNGTLDENGVEPFQEGDAVFVTESRDEARIYISNEYRGTWRRFTGNGPPPGVAP
jgi:hypothetical protein